MNDWAIAGLAVAAWFVLSIALGLLLGRAIARNGPDTRPARERPSHARLGPHRPPRKAPTMTTALTALAWALVGWLAVGFLASGYAICRMWKDSR